MCEQCITAHWLVVSGFPDIREYHVARGFAEISPFGATGKIFD
jgi:hypothetical protein